MATVLMLTEDEIEELDLPWSCHTEWMDGRDHRWSYGMSGVFKYQDTNYLIEWQHPASETQQDSDCYPWDSFEFPIEAVRVVEKEVITTRWVTDE